MNELLSFLVEPFQYSFMLRGLWASLIVGVVCPILGAYVVLRGMAFFGDALAHIILPGVVIAFLLGWPYAVGALIFGVLAALLIGFISRRTDIKNDTAIGVVFAGAFALGIALISLQRSYAVDLTHILFGDLLGVSNSDLMLMGILGFLVLVTVFAFYKEFLVLSFDPILAKTLRLPVNFLQNLLLVLLAVVIGSRIQSDQGDRGDESAEIVSAYLPFAASLKVNCRFPTPGNRVIRDGDVVDNPTHNGRVCTVKDVAADHAFSDPGRAVIAVKGASVNYHETVVAVVADEIA